MSLFTLLIVLIVIGAITLVVRSVIRIYKRPTGSLQPRVGVPVFSISMLSVSLVLLIIGTWVTLQVSDALGGAISGVGGFFGLFESHVRHKREALLEKTTEEGSDRVVEKGEI